MYKNGFGIKYPKNDWCPLKQNKTNQDMLFSWYGIQMLAER